MNVMRTIIQGLGIFFICLAILYMVKPGVMRWLIDLFNKGKRIYIAGLIRLVLAIVFLLAARECDVTWVIVLFGVLFLIEAILVFALSLKLIQSYISWWQKQSNMLLRIVAGVVLAIGVIIVYCA